MIIQKERMRNIRKEIWLCCNEDSKWLSRKCRDSTKVETARGESGGAEKGGDKI